MDEWLAGIYGTGQGENLEKTAQAEWLAKLAEDEGIDLSGLSEEQLAALAQEVAQMQAQGQPGQPGMGAPMPPPGVPPMGMAPPQRPLTGFAPPPPVAQPPQADPAQQQAQLVKEAQAKFEEADFLGRVMAHAYTNELEKIAGARAMAGKAGKAVAGAAGKAAGHVKSHKGAYGAGAGAGAAGFAAGRASKSKEASIAIEKLAAYKVAEVLQANGIDPSTLQPMQDPTQQAQTGQPDAGQVDPNQQAAQQPQNPAQAAQGMNQEPQLTDEQMFDNAVNERALEMLHAAGFTFADEQQAAQQ